MDSSFGTCTLYAGHTPAGTPTSLQEKWSFGDVTGGMTCSTGFSNFGICGGGCYQLLGSGSWTGNWNSAKSGCEGLGTSVHLAGEFTLTLRKIYNRLF